ncbi:MAG: hypothetical protein M3Q56_08395 [Bacteroidota bacterium]|nr:hypothetical protein [Bacteroidota bacterium]
MKKILFITFNCISTFMIAQVTPGGIPRTGQGTGISGQTTISIAPFGTAIPFIPNSPNQTGGFGAPTGDQDRAVFWLHGLDGDETSWAKAADASQHGVPAFAARKIISMRPEYGEGAGLEAAAEDVRIEMEQWADHQRSIGIDPKNNFIIAHSQGGLVEQALLYKDFCFDPNFHGPAYGGVVSFGAGHKGAMILNNVEILKDWLKQGCSDLAAGPAEEFSNSFIGQIVGLFVEDKDNPLLPENITKNCETFVKEVSKFLDLTKPITKDYHVPADGGSKLYDYESCIIAEAGNIAKVAFYGVEPHKDLPWRTLNWQVLKNSNDEDYFEANDDDELTMKINNFKDKYKAEIALREIYTIILKGDYDLPCSPVDWIFRPIECAIGTKKLDDNLDELEKYKTGLRWLNTSDDKWQEIIGAIVITKTTKHFCQCVDQYTNEEKYEINDPSECDPRPEPGKKCWPTKETYITKSYKESDGIVLAESASAMPGANHNPTSDPLRRMENSSHNQMRNDLNTKRKLNYLYNGKTNDFFYTNLR